MAVKRNTGIDLQHRDLSVLRHLFESRVMTLAHVTALNFEGKSEAAKKRMQKIKATGLVTERPRHGTEPGVLFLTREGFQVLSDRQQLEGYPAMTWAEIENRVRVSDLTLRHELAVMDVKAVVCSAVKNLISKEVAEFSTWPFLFEFQACPGVNTPEITLKPDGFIRIHETDGNGEKYEHTFYLEVDRSTETQEHLVMKAGCYVDHYRRGGLAVRHGRPPSEYKDFPFRTLIVLQNPERRNNTAERLLMRQPPILSQIWLTTMKEILADPLGEIWIRPLDYRNATTGTSFEAGHPPSMRGYRRQLERESIVEKTVRKHKLLEPDGE